MFSGSSRSGIPDSTSLTWKMNARGLRSRKLAAPARPQPAAQLIASLRQARADRAFGDARQAGDLAVVVAMVIAEHDIRGHARGQPGQRCDDDRSRRGRPDAIQRWWPPRPPPWFCQRLRPGVTCTPIRLYTRSARWQSRQSAWWDWRRWA